MQIHDNDVVLTRPKAIHDLSIGDVVLLPICGEARVMKRPFFDPPDKRDVVHVIVSTKAGIMKLSCTRSTCFQYLGYILD